MSANVNKVTPVFFIEDFTVNPLILPGLGNAGQTGSEKDFQSTACLIQHLMTVYLAFILGSFLAWSVNDREYRAIILSVILILVLILNVN